MFVIKTGEMLGKKLFLTTFCLTLFWVSATEAARNWEKTEIAGVIGSTHYLLKDGRQVELMGIAGVDLEFPNNSESCLTETTKIKLESLLVGKANIKIKHDRIKPPRAHIWPVYMKFGTQDLAEFLLYEGLATIKEERHLYSKKYKEAQASAQKAHRGRWGQCNPHLNLLKWKKARGRTKWFWDRYHPYLGAVSVGKVTKVLSGNSFQLENGLRVQLKNIRLPGPGESGSVQACFLEASRARLSSLIMGQTVLLRADDGFLSDYKTVLRDVYLPQTSWRQELWVNQLMISTGYARLDGDSTELQEVQAEVWKTPVGAWKKCLSRQPTAEP